MGLSLDAIALATGLSFYPPPGPFNGKSGSLMGFKRGFLVSAGLRDQDGRFCVLVRFKSVADPKGMIAMLKNDAAMKQMYKLADINMAGEQSLLWTFGKPRTFDEQKFAAAVESMLNIMGAYAKPFKERYCEGDGCINPVDHLTLANGIPNLMCDDCKAKVIAQQDSMRQQYERRQPRADLALLYGLGAAIAIGLLVGLIQWWDFDDNKFHPKLFIVLTILIAGVVAWAVKTGVRNVTVGACVLATVLAIVGKVIADVFFFTRVIAADIQQPIDLQFVVGVLANLWTIKWGFNGFVAVMDVLAILLTGYFCWKLKPNFSVAFKVVNLPNDQPQVAAAKA
jgi:hypothetical protein